MSNEDSAVAKKSAANGNGAKRKQGLTLVAVALGLAFAAYGGYEWFIGQHYEKTDNAYVQAHVVQITPLVAGTVRAINADDTDFVKAGQPLVSLDQADARVALDQARAQLAQTVREVRTLYANNSTFASQVKARDADVKRAQTELARLEADVARRAPLLSTGAIGKEELDHAQAQVTAARASLAAAESAQQAAKDQLNSNEALTDGTSVVQHPNVQRAAARVSETFLALQRTELPAPVNGWVARRSVQLGQRVAAGAPLMSVVSLQDAWVDANFKEGQLARLRIGQPVTLEADVYGEKVEFHGHVSGLGAGTGAAFSLLPAQNATGNWIKVVQRVPVRIALDPEELKAHPLRAGLSTVVTIDTHNRDGQVDTALPLPNAVLNTSVFDEQLKVAEAKADAIIAQQAGHDE
ncbi:MAG: efflux RND transporter periplasmic adaptor subunit [Burkholderiaceae bacterium]|nr:efflux RND transporter periplasmic adaptor subunit [Burkholderiaceae bacterium]